MECVLQGISGVVVYLDDTLITGETEEEHLQTLDEVLIRLGLGSHVASVSLCDHQ